MRLHSVSICILGAAALLAWAGCGTVGPTIARPEPPFRFGADTFAFANELHWEYSEGDNGAPRRHRKNDPPPIYALHCFVLARSAVQFRENAHSAPEQAGVSDATYRRLVRAVVKRSLRGGRPPQEKIVIPGFANLYEFSAAKPSLLRDNCGDWWQSYLQRSHWRMTLPLSRHHQRKTAEELLRAVEKLHTPIVHLVRFPQLTINHAVVIYAGTNQGDRITFRIYDPNRPGYPGELTFHRGRSRFAFSANNYFAGGRVDVYQVYHSWNY